jgi:hypothetical protein
LKPQSRSELNTRSSFRSFVAVLAGLALLAGACSGGGGGGGLSEKRAGELSEQFILNVFGILTGDVDAQRMIDSFAPECRQGISAAEIQTAAGFIVVFLPQLAEIEIEDVDLGELEYERTEEGILVTPVDPNGIRVKVEGRFMNANEFFSSLGLESEDDSPASPTEPLLIVERDGKAYIGDCTQLQDFGGD